MRERKRKIPSSNAGYLQAMGRQIEQAKQTAEECAKLVSLPVQHTHAAGIDVGDATHWVCVEQTPDGSAAVREFPARV
jgi:hypothetical protein